MSQLTTIQEFQVFCLESYRAFNKVTSENALKTFQQLGVFDFLQSGYDVLHTQSKDYIVSEINEFINQRK